MPIEIVQREVCDLAGANAESSEQQHDCAVSETERGIAPALVYDLFMLPRAEVRWQAGQLPLSDGRHRALESARNRAVGH